MKKVFASIGRFFNKNVTSPLRKALIKIGEFYIEKIDPILSHNFLKLYLGRKRREQKFYHFFLKSAV